jgi:hypothetical protein
MYSAPNSLCVSVITQVLIKQTKDSDCDEFEQMSLSTRPDLNWQNTIHCHGSVDYKRFE